MEFALSFDEPDDTDRDRAARRKLERYKNSREGRLAASINSGDSRMVAEAPQAPHEVHANHRFTRINLLKRHTKPTKGNK
jgi:hypothetical protein